VILRKDPNAQMNPFEGLTEKELLLKAKIAMQLIEPEDFEVVKGVGVEFLHAKKTAGGGVVLVLKTEEAAKWLNGKDAMRRFAEELVGTATAGAALCMVIAEYVPVIFSPNMPYATLKVEEDSNLEKGAIREVWFIKKAHWRAQGQKTVHIIVGLSSPEQANIAIRHGIIIEGKRVVVHRHRMDPKICMKCQGIGVNHNAAACKFIHDVCTRCAEMHHTDQCTVVAFEDFKCANCKMKGHRAIDRECPIFKEKSHLLHANIPNYAYRFFPTWDPATWEREGNSERGEERNNRPPEQTQGQQMGSREDTGKKDRDRDWTHNRDNGWPGATRGGNGSMGNGETMQQRADKKLTHTQSKAGLKQARVDEMMARPPSMVGVGAPGRDNGRVGRSWADDKVGIDLGPAGDNTQEPADDFYA
jgi:hypothetical protein